MLKLAWLQMWHAVDFVSGVMTEAAKICTESSKLNDNENMLASCRVAKCHGYDEYIRVKIFAA